MRVLVCSDAVGGLASARAGRCLADGWSEQRTAVVPVGEAGGGFVGATADRWGATEEPVVVEDRVGVRAYAGGRAAVALPGPGVGEGPVPYAASSLPLGRVVAESLSGSAGEGRASAGVLLVDLVSDDVHDGGAGLLAALGAEADVDLTAGVAGLRGLSRLDLAEPRRLLAGTDLVGVVPGTALATPLLGLRGITSVRGRAAGEDAEPLLAADASLQQLAELVGSGLGAAPGAGACGGTGLAVLALGGRLASGPDLALGGISSPVDLVVTGCSVFDFAHRGGGVVAAAAALAGRLLAPCVVVAGEVVIGAREMRTMGIEAAYAVHESAADQPEGLVTADELTATARRVARSWRW